MPNPFESLFAAIVDDDRAKVKELLDNDPGLTQRGVSEKSRCESSIAHWMYSGDTLLHLEAGADPTIRNKPGSTPFHLAVQNTGRGSSGSDQARTAQREILQAFLERGVSPNLKDAKGKSVREWARSDWIQKMLAENAF